MKYIILICCLVLCSCAKEKDPIETITQLENVNSIHFFLIVGNDKIEKRTITEKSEIDRFLQSFKPVHEEESVSINEKNFKKDAEIDICYDNSKQHLIIEVDTKNGYCIELGSNKYFEPFTYQTGRIIIESLAE